MYACLILTLQSARSLLESARSLLLLFQPHHRKWGFEVQLGRGLWPLRKADEQGQRELSQAVERHPGKVWR